MCAVRWRSLFDSFRREAQIAEKICVLSPLLGIFLRHGCLSCLSKVQQGRAYHRAYTPTIAVDLFSNNVRNVNHLPESL